MLTIKSHTYIVGMTEILDFLSWAWHKSSLSTPSRSFDEIPFGIYMNFIKIEFSLDVQFKAPHYVYSILRHSFFREPRSIMADQ